MGDLLVKSGQAISSSSIVLKSDGERQRRHERKSQIRPVFTSRMGLIHGFDTWVGLLEFTITVYYLWFAEVVLILLTVSKGGCQRMYHPSLECGNTEQCKH